MKEYLKSILILLLISTFTLFNACTTVPLTGRKQMHLLPESQMVSMSLTSYSEFISTHKLSASAVNSTMVKRAGKNISTAVAQYLASVGKADLVKDYAWEFNLVEDAQPNAWCMPGGKVVVYTGILPYTLTEAGLAVVMGHEIAHAVARHGNERMSQGMLVQFGGMALDVALQSKPEQTKAIFMQAYGVGSQVGMLLPYSRIHESEADKLGLVFMAMAGYDPNEAITFWERMAKSGGQKPPEILSTHPADETRIADLKAYLPEALKFYKKK
ncbi:MAG: peptidase M48 [Bacteroidetes bacterium CG2_30_33_31]|nr:MAG: peptidase M48 [Bacteroidetes bacterium CG2_30_33_31]